MLATFARGLRPLSIAMVTHSHNMRACFAIFEVFYYEYIRVPFYSAGPLATKSIRFKGALLRSHIISWFQSQIWTTCIFNVMAGVKLENTLESSMPELTPTVILENAL
jgi:hypothetical protein